MQKKISLSFIVVLIVSSMLMASCSSDKDSASSTEKKLEKAVKAQEKKNKNNRVSSKASRSDFQLDFDDVCDNLDDSSFSGNYASSDYSTTTDQENVISEFDGIISDIEDLDVPSKNKRDIETIVENLKVMRDSRIASFKVSNEGSELQEAAKSATSQAEVDGYNVRILQINTELDEFKDTFNSALDVIGAISEELDLTCFRVAN